MSAKHCGLWNPVTTTSKRNALSITTAPSGAKTWRYGSTPLNSWGGDSSLVLHGGGNTSVKSTATELSGEQTKVLYVKGSGWDLGGIEPKGFPACRLEPLLRYCQLERMSDEEMVAGLRSQMLNPASPTPSVEALLHAFIPGRYVDHTHSDAVLAVVDQPDSEKRVREVWGEEAIFIPYVMPGFVLARAVAEIGDAIHKSKLMILDKHGIFTWGESAKESYERMIHAVDAAERYIANEKKALSSSSAPSPSVDERKHKQRNLSPLVRGALAQGEQGKRFMLEWRDEEQILSLLARDDAEKLTRIGTATPDHVIRIKPLPLWLGELRDGQGSPEKQSEIIKNALGNYKDWYDQHVEHSSKERNRQVDRLDPLPRVILVPGLGALCVGNSLKDARIAGDIYAHTATVIQNCAALGEYRPVTMLDLFDTEYWSLEQAKLKKGAQNKGPLSHQIALVTGAASGIGLTTAEMLLARGAHVMLSDRDAESLQKCLSELQSRYGVAVSAKVADVTDDQQIESLIQACLGSFGGIDILVSNAGNAPSGLLHTDEGQQALKSSLELNLLSHQKMASAVAQVLITQGMGGSLLFNASKSAFNQGPKFGPYAIAKAGVVALMKQYAVDLGAYGIRSNAINADRIRTSLFGGGVLEARAKARGLSPDDYFKSNLLSRETTASDVADAFCWLATASATTGCVVTVDGGNAAAFPR